MAPASDRLGFFNHWQGGFKFKNNDMIIIYILYAFSVLLLVYIGWSIYRKRSFTLDQAIAALSIVISIVLTIGINNAPKNNLTLDSSGRLFEEISGVPPTDEAIQVDLCTIERVKPVFLSPDEAWFQIKYEVSPSHEHPVFIAIRPLSTRSTIDIREFEYNPAGRLPDGVPKGKQTFNEDILVGLLFYGEYSTVTTDLSFSIYDDTKATLCSSIVEFPYRWSTQY